MYRNTIMQWLIIQENLTEKTERKSEEETKKINKRKS